MLPSMPILFSRDSQEAFGSRIQPSTSFFSQNSSPKVIPEVAPEVPKEAPKQVVVKSKTEPAKKKDDPPSNDDNALENAFVRSYYHRVQSRFSSNTSVPKNKFVQFQTILREFNPNTESPVELYKKIENLFGVEHKDIVEDFLLMLTPGQAVEAGRFMDRFQLVQMTAFINLLQKTFVRKPTVLRRIVRALSAALGGADAGGATVRARVLPHLRSSPRLVALFKSLFPDERPPDSLYESGVDTAHESLLSGVRGCDVWELHLDTKRRPQHNTKRDTMYMNGRVFLQHGRLLRPARVTFPYSKEPYRVHARRLAPTLPHPTPPDSDEDTLKDPPKNKPPKRTRKQAKSPTKKDVNDNTKNNCLLSPKPKKSQKNKNGKKEEVKRKEKALKRDDAPKPKQAKIEANAEVKIEPKTEIEVSDKIDLKIPDNETLTESVVVENKKEAKVKSNDWTRDEDKTMLQVLKGEAGSEQVFAKIRELLPHRTAAEIKDRFCHVMTLLQQMAGSELT